ncbi:protein gamma response 1 [Silene latifolia]|uniref:protein gamma response 1 n=1 Tax=Silene latifolia TaxID=37657 RepID=UPI003D773D5F
MQCNYLDSEKSPEMGLPVEGNDTKYISGLSTILVASIQEAKDRISQVEYIFCSQLYPNFQKNSKCAEKLYSEARAVAEDEWKGQVSDLKNQLNGIFVEKEQAIEECKAAQTENVKLLERVAVLEEMLATKTKEVDEGSRFHAKLLEVVESKSSVIISIEKQLKEKEEKINSLLEKFREQEEKVMTLSKDLQEKHEEVNKGKKLEKEFIRKIDTQTLTISNHEQMVSNFEKEKKQLAVQLENMEACVSGLRNELRRKSIELEEATHLQEQSVEQVNRNKSELTKKEQLLSACEKEKQVLLSRITNLENNVEECRDKPRNGTSMTPNVNVLAKQLELKNAELSAESQKRRDVVAAYKKLKSQQIFLLRKLGPTSEGMLLQIKEEEGSDHLSNDNKTSAPPEIKIKNPVGNVFGAELSKVKKEVDSMQNSDDELSGQLNQMANSRSPPCSSSPVRTNWTTKKVLSSSAGTKRPASGWRETRSRQSPGGADPHDDFLDTPYDNIRGNLIKAVQDNQHNATTLNSKEAVSDSSDDETQDMRPRPGPDKHVQKARKVGPKDFKFVEPVRKKAERENLNGIECKQCKKFYDAVHGDGEGKEGEINKHNLRCEHHDGVSRHRYRYIPPMTPEGFWNIGFDTEN